jgi:hypothetical protein
MKRKLERENFFENVGQAMKVTKKESQGSKGRPLCGSNELEPKSLEEILQSTNSFRVRVWNCCLLGVWCW